MAIPKIGLDGGHGLKTAGKQTPDGIKEWTLNDKVCDKATTYLSAYECEIIRTDNNEGNVDEKLADRLNRYINAGCEAFASVHHNAFKSVWGDHTGVEVYVDNNATADDLKLAECIRKRLAKYTGLKDRGIKRKNFAVINQNRIPAVLVEGGFMDSTIDYKVITSDKGQDAYARAVAEGMVEFLALKKKETPVQPTTAGIKAGDLVSIKSGAKYYNGKSVPSWVQTQKWYVDSVKGDRAVINKSENGKSAINSPINVLYLTIAKASVTPVKTISVGSTVKVKQGAKTYTNGNLASFVYGRKHKVKEIKGDRVVITYLGITIAAVNIKDLTLV